MSLRRVLQLSRHKNFVNPSLVKLSAEVDPACSAFAFQLDADRVKQVLTNGLLNAIRVSVRSRFLSDHVVMCDVCVAPSLRRHCQAV